MATPRQLMNEYKALKAEREILLGQIATLEEQLQALQRNLRAKESEITEKRFELDTEIDRI